jgi:hypothetical protein
MAKANAAAGSKAAERQKYFREQVFLWVQEFRPDVLDDCRKAAEQEYPKVGKKGPKKELNKSIKATAKPPKDLL